MSAPGKQTIYIRQKSEFCCV